ncbi:hypothetical protein ACU686_21070 [Yinghuangia aomiensis]
MRSCRRARRLRRRRRHADRPHLRPPRARRPPHRSGWCPAPSATRKTSHSTSSGWCATATPPRSATCAAKPSASPRGRLVNDPANGHHALALVRDIERLDRQARSKPGFAKDGFAALGERLGRAVPHFLPTFYEQAARIFLAHDNTTYAATFFGKARDAERVHNLVVEEERLRAVFLEFAFAGALTAKALKEYARDLSRRLGPDEAWTQFRRLCVERGAAGMAPYAGLAEDARSMIKATGRDQAAEERALIAELLPGSAIVRAPVSFWKTFAKPLAAAAAEQPELRIRLLEIMPNPAPARPRTSTTRGWHPRRRRRRGTPHHPGRPGARQGGGLVQPLGRAHPARLPRPRPHAETLALAARMAPALRTGGGTVGLFGATWRKNADPDLLDLLLAEGVAVETPPDGASLELADWFKDSGDGRRDLAAAAGRPAHRPAPARRRREARQRRQRPALPATAATRCCAAACTPGSRTAPPNSSSRRGCPTRSRSWSVLRPFARVCADVHPDAAARVAAFDPAPILARTLRAGILDELGWPALDEAMKLLGAEGRGIAPGYPDDSKLVVNTDEAWPALILSTPTKAVVVGPDGILLDHDLRIPGKARRPRPHPVLPHRRRPARGGARTTPRRPTGRSRPADVFEPTGEVPNRWGYDPGYKSLPHPGRRPRHRRPHLPRRRHRAAAPPGSRGRRHRLLGVEHRRIPVRLVRVRPGHRQPRPRRAARPVSRRGCRDGGSLVVDECTLRPMQPGLEDTPFGTDGRLLGSWVRIDDRGVATASTTDGHTAAPPAVDYCGTGRPRWSPSAASRSQAPARRSPSRRARPLLRRRPPPRRREAPEPRQRPRQPHPLRPRPSRTGTRCGPRRSRLAGAPRHRHRAGPRADRRRPGRVRRREGRRRTGRGGHRAAAARDTSRPRCPASPHPRIADGVGGITLVAARLRRGLTAFGNPPAASAQEPDEYQPQHGEDETIAAAAEGFAGRAYWYSGGTSFGILSQIRTIAGLLATSPDPDAAAGWSTTRVRLASPKTDWTPLVGNLEPLLFRAASAYPAANHRAAIRLLADELSAEALHRPGQLRRVCLAAEQATGTRVGDVLRNGDRMVVIIAQDGWGHDRQQVWRAVDYDPSGAFAAVDGFTVHDEHRFDYPDDRARVAELLRVVAESGPIAWNPAHVEALCADTDLRPRKPRTSSPASRASARGPPSRPTASPRSASSPPRPTPHAGGSAASGARRSAGCCAPRSRGTPRRCGPKARTRPPWSPRGAPRSARSSGSPRKSPTRPTRHTSVPTSSKPSSTRPTCRT